MSDRREAAESLRASLLRIDKSILSLVAARMNIADVLGEVKKESGMSVYDPSREITVANLLAEEAAKLGVPPSLAKEIYFMVARETRCRQLYCPEAVRIAVYGYGGMGRMLAGMLARAGCWVAVTGRDPVKAREAAEAVGAKYMEPEYAIDWADMLLYTVPTGALEDLLRKHWGLFRESMLIADIASVKTPVARLLETLYRSRQGGPEYVSLHPLFGPLSCPAGENIAVVPIRLERWRERLEGLLQGLGLVPVYVSPDEHDRAMAVNQVLHHLVYELYRRASERLVADLGVQPSSVKELVTWSLRQTLSVLARLEKLRPVIEEIRHMNPYTREVLQALRAALDEVERETTIPEGED